MGGTEGGVAHLSDQPHPPIAGCRLRGEGGLRGFSIEEKVEIILLLRNAPGARGEARSVKFCDRPLILDRRSLILAKPRVVLAPTQGRVVGAGLFKMSVGSKGYL